MAARPGKPVLTVYYGKAGSADESTCYTLSTTSMECVACQKSDLDARLQKCQICFKWICEDCASRGFGRFFCSKKCSDQFFFGDDDDE